MSMCSWQFPIMLDMFTLRICPKMTKSEKPWAPGVALSFAEVMKKNIYRIYWQGNVSFWARLCKYNCSLSSIKLTRLSVTTFVGNEIKKVSIQKLFFVSTVEKFQILEYRKPNIPNKQRKKPYYTSKCLSFFQTVHCNFQFDIINNWC